MASYSITDLERLLKVKGYVIRYWEKVIPLIQPIRNKKGRRVYSDLDLQLFIRLKYLLHERRFTVDGARAQLYRELAGGHQDLRANISALRSELLSLLFMVKNSSSEAGNNYGDKVNTEEPAS